MGGDIYSDDIVSSRYYYLNTSNGRLRYVVHQLNIPLGNEVVYNYHGTICGKRTAVAKATELFTEIITVPYTAIGGKLKFESESVIPYTDPSDPTVTALFRTNTTVRNPSSYGWQTLCFYHDYPPHSTDTSEIHKYLVFTDMFVGTNGKIAWNREVPFFHWDNRAYVTKNINSNTFGEITIKGNIAFPGAFVECSGINYMQESLTFILTNSVAGELVTEIPYSGIPDTDADGGMGKYDFTDSDNIDFPPLPTLSAVSTGFVSLWSPTEEQMLRLSSFMWNADILTTDFWKKLIANPMELIYGLSLVPLNLSSLGYIDSEGTVVVGLINTGITMNHLSSQWVLFDCGTITLDETWGAYLDYDPYTKLEIYLPFCGAHPLKVDDFMPGTISLKYYIDLLSGTCVAVVKSIKSNKHGDVLDSVVYQFMGNCAAQIPVTAQQFADAVRAAINIAASIGSMVATGVGGAAAAAGAKNALGGISTTAHTVSQEVSTGASVVENVMNIKPAIERSGAIGSAGSLLSVRTPYLILTRPRMARPESQNVYTGYPSFITETLGDLKGWTIVQAIHLDNIPCTADEINEIDELLKGGVIF